MTPQTYPSFGHWLKARRKALDLTQQALAFQVGCSAETLRKIEANRLRPSRTLVERFAARLGLSPEERDLFVRLARSSSDVARLPEEEGVDLPAPLHVPAPLTPLIGREQDAARALTLLEDASVRLLTLIGPPGVGKTRLALHIASQARSRFADGAVFVALAALNDPAQMPFAIAQALQPAIPRMQWSLFRLHDYLRDRHLLLVLDNFEHMLAAAPQVAGLLAAAPRVTVLATSRAPLNISGEQAFVVAPLELPDLASLPLIDTLARCPAVDLFVQRARAVRPDFVLSEANARDVAEICVALDGLPLAIELAAAWSKLFSPHALRMRLEQPLEWLTGGGRDAPPHQQTLRGALDWSCRLLGEEEQQLLARLGVFAGSFTIAAVEAICASDGVASASHPSEVAPSQVLEHLLALIDHSLVSHAPWRTSAMADRHGEDPPDRTPEPRFTLLRTIREYALERLVASGHLDTMRQRHAAYYLALAEEAAAQLFGPMQIAWLNRLDQEHDELRAALNWVLEHAETEIMLRLTAALSEFWLRRGYASEGREWTCRALALADARSLPLPLRRVQARVLKMAWSLEMLFNDQALLAALPSEDLAFWRASGDWRGLNDALHTETLRAVARGDYATARALQQENVALCQRVRDEQQLGAALFCLAINVSELGNFAEAEALFPETIRLLQATGDNWTLSYLLGFMGDLALRRGDEASAQIRLQQAVSLFHQVGDSWSAAHRLRLLGRISRQQNDTQAAAYFHESFALFRHLGDRRGIALCLASIAGIASASDDPRRATRLLSAAAALLNDDLSALSPEDQALFEQTRTRTHAQIGEAAFASEWQAGQRMAQELGEALRDDVEAVLSPDP